MSAAQAIVEGISTSPVQTLPRRNTVDRCWICLEELSNNRREWVYPCMCSLVCHEECLLHWISESERRVRSGVVC
ncbi:hypothetical protein H4S00_003256 [Coemansia sp. D1744]|nr:hypothetical protein H4S00_003256 [Coemansia sp. D1744]